MKFPRCVVRDIAPGTKGHETLLKASGRHSSRGWAQRSHCPLGSRVAQRAAAAEKSIDFMATRHEYCKVAFVEPRHTPIGGKGTPWGTPVGPNRSLNSHLAVRMRPSTAGMPSVHSSSIR